MVLVESGTALRPGCLQLLVAALAEPGQGQLRDFADDPLWDVLAELDGRRPGTPPDVDLEAAAPLRLPRAWLRRWPPPGGTYIARWDSDRLVVRHLEAGFAVADVPCPPHVMLSLENVDLSVRVAGLDRDLGWVLVLGRIVLFHFLEER